MSTQIKKAVFGPLTANEENAPAVVISFPDATTIEAGLAGFSPEVVTRLAIHGLSQKLGDSYAGAKQADNPLTHAKSRVKEVLEQLIAGDWRVVGEGGARPTLLARALARATGQTEEAALELIQSREDGDADEGKAFKAALRKHPDVKKATADIKAEEAAKAAKATEGQEAPDLGGLFKS